jgi:hypothetical protein
MCLQWCHATNQLIDNDLPAITARSHACRALTSAAIRAVTGSTG